MLAPLTKSRERAITIVMMNELKKTVETPVVSMDELRAECRRIRAQQETSFADLIVTHVNNHCMEDSHNGQEE